MAESEPWSYHPDGSPVYALADIIRKRAAVTPAAIALVIYGAAKCRAIFTAVNNRLSAREVLAILADAEPRVVITDPPAAPLVTGAGSLGFDCDTLVTDLDYLAWRDHARASDPGETAGPGETALLLYTSGTTGAPKGVELTGRNLGCALHELHTGIGLDTSSVCAAPIPFFHMLALPEAKTTDWSALSYVVTAPRRSRCPCSRRPPRRSAASSCSPTA